MGYYSTVTGELTFMPNITRKQVDEFDQKYPSASFFANISESGAFPDYQQGKAYTLETEIASLLVDLKKLGIDVNGALVVCGEESPDIWRINVRNNVPTREDAKTVWPDGTEYRA